MAEIKYSIANPYFPKEEIDPILNKFRKILEGKEMLSMGKYVRQFEESFSQYVGSTRAVGTNSCSAALEISLRSIGLKKEDEVIVPAETFIATGSTVVREGGRVVFADIDPNTFCLSADTVMKKMTKKTKAIILVHMAGLVTPEVFKIRDFCRSHSIALVEDAAHAHGASFDGKMAGSFGDFGCFSFYPTKVITTGEGGMLTTSNEKYCEMANSFRHRGRDFSVREEVYSRLGTNNRMSEMVAILGLSQLSVLDSFVNARNKVAKIYSESLLDFEKKEYVTLLKLDPKSRHSYWRYIVRLNELIDRNKLQDILAESGIATDWAYYPPLHLQPVFRNLYGNGEGMLPKTEKLMKHFVCLPIHPGLNEKDSQFVIETFKNAVREML